MGQKLIVQKVVDSISYSHNNTLQNHPSFIKGSAISQKIKRDYKTPKFFNNAPYFSNINQKKRGTFIKYVKNVATSSVEWCNWFLFNNIYSELLINISYKYIVNIKIISLIIIINCNCYCWMSFNTTCSSRIQKWNSTSKSFVHIYMGWPFYILQIHLFSRKQWLFNGCYIFIFQAFQVSENCTFFKLIKLELYACNIIKYIPEKELFNYEDQNFCPD